MTVPAIFSFCSSSLLYSFIIYFLALEMQLNRNLKQKSEHEAEKRRITRTVGFKFRTIAVLIDSPLRYANCRLIFFGFYITFSAATFEPFRPLHGHFTATHGH